MRTEVGTHDPQLKGAFKPLGQHGLFTRWIEVNRDSCGSSSQKVSLFNRGLSWAFVICTRRNGNTGNFSGRGKQSMETRRTNKAMTTQFGCIVKRGLAVAVEWKF